jgi:hypothetical protein
MNARRLTWHDAAATVLVSVIVASYVGYLVDGSTPLVHDTREMAAAGMALGIAACALGAQNPGVRSARLPVAVAMLAVAATLLGLIALITGGAVPLALFMIAVTVLWAVAIARHSGLSHAVRARSTRRPANPRARPTRP